MRHAFRYFRLRRFTLVRLLSIVTLTTLCAGCVADMVGAVKDSREEIKKQLREPDPQGQDALRRSWYGRLLTVLYAPVDGNAVLRDQLDDKQVAELRGLLQDVLDSMSRSGSERDLDAPLLAALDLPNAGKKISVVVLRDDAHYIFVKPVCAPFTIEFSAEAVREIVKTALKQDEVNELQTMAEQFFFGMFHIDASTEEMDLVASPVSVLLGPPRSKFVTKKLEQDLGAQATVVWKALAFIMGHEAHHLWSHRCTRTEDNAAQQRIEAQADVLGTILAITTYNRRCGRTLVASRQDASTMLSDTAPPALPMEVTYQMAIVPSPTLLVGASGMATLQSSLGPLLHADPSHPDSTTRIAIDERGTQALAAKLFDQPVKHSWMAALVGKAADLTKEELIASIYGDLQFKSNYHLVDNYLICTNIEFESKPNNPGVF